MIHSVALLSSVLLLANVAAIAPTVTDRLMAYFRMLVRAEFPRMTFLGCYEYAIQGGGPGSYTIAPTDPTIPLPGSGGIPLRLSCATATLPQGSLVLIMFVNGDPSRPFIFSGAPVPQVQTIDASQQLNLGPSAPLVALAQASDFVVLTNKLVSALASTLASGTCAAAPGPVVFSVPVTAGEIAAANVKAS